MESQRPNTREDEASWHLPELQKDRSEPILERKHYATMNGKETDVKELIPNSWYVFFSQASESPNFIIRENKRFKNVFSLPSELSTINVFCQIHKDEEKEDNFKENKEEPKKQEEKKRVRKYRIIDDDMMLKYNAMLDYGMRMQDQVSDDNNVHDDMKLKYNDVCAGMFDGMVDDIRKRLLMEYSAICDGIEDDMIMQLEATINDDVSSLPCQPSSIDDKEIQQVYKQHGPNTDFESLDDAYGFVTFRREIYFHIYQGSILKQRTPLGNTVLHLAARYGNDEKVKEVAQYGPQLFTVLNNNNDTALHVAARMGRSSTIKLLLNAFFVFIRCQTSSDHHAHQSILEMMLMVSLTLFRNKQGNTFLHEAFKIGCDNGAAIFHAFEAPFLVCASSEFEASFKRIVNQLAPFAVNVDDRSLLYMTIEVNCTQVVNQLLDFCIEGELKPEGKSPLLPTLVKNNSDLLETILSKTPDWIHYLGNEKGWLPLHYAAHMGNLQGVSYLVKTCPSCTMERDNNGNLPIHLACMEGHIKIFQKLLQWCLDPAETVNDLDQNLLHVACKNGNYEVVKYLLNHPKVEVMINQMDFEGNTPLHLATKSSHPKIVHTLTWDNRVNLALLNNNNRTALDIAEESQGKIVPLAQRLTWNALVSAGTPRSSARFHAKDGTNKSFTHNSTHSTEQYKDRIDTLIVVSTLIITTSFAAGFTIPGDVDHGIPVLLNRHMFHLFILSLTVSLFGSISSTIILLWARLEDLHLATFALTCAIPLLGLSLMTLSIAFLAGMYLILSKLNWFATIFLVIGVVLILMVLLLYSLLWLPRPSTIPFFRYISYYPFLFFAEIGGGKTYAKKMGSKDIIPVL